MSVYVDKMGSCAPNKNWPYKEACHLIADTVKELHELAQGIGLKREWFQDKSLPHYDLTFGMRCAAVRAGAIEVGMRKFVNLMRKIRDANIESRREPGDD